MIAADMPGVRAPIPHAVIVVTGSRPAERAGLFAAHAATPIMRGNNRAGVR